MGKKNVIINNTIVYPRKHIGFSATLYVNFQ